MFNSKTIERLREAIVPYLKNKKDWEKEIERKIWEVLTTNMPVHTLVSEIKGHVKLKNEKDHDYLVLWLMEGKERIYVHEDKLKRPEAWQEILSSKYRKRIAYLDFQKHFKLKILTDIRYEDVVK